MSTSTVEIPEHIPGEPYSAPPTVGRYLKQLLTGGLLVLLASLSLLIFGVPYWLTRIFMPRPPNIPAVGQFVRYLLAIGRSPLPGRSHRLLHRLSLMTSVVRMWLTSPMRGLCWQLDELLFARTLAAHPVKAPLIELSAARSGSTQLAHYLEDDPALAAPNTMMTFLPYLWLWKLVDWLVAPHIDRQALNARMLAKVPEQMLQRHEMNIFRTDTFEVFFYSHHLNTLSIFVDDDFFCQNMCFARYCPENEALFEHDFVKFVEGVGRRTLAFKGPQADGSARRFFFKGHFLMAADALERHFPDATFLTMIREPAKRFQSTLNFLRCAPGFDLYGSIPWPWLVKLMETEEDYCRLEQAWFSRPGPARRCVIPFHRYVKDLEGTLTKVYQECMGVSELPPHLPRVHVERVRTHYLVDRSLAQLGIDEQALNTRLASYVAWCRQP